MQTQSYTLIFENSIFAIIIEISLIAIIKNDECTYEISLL